MVTVVGIHYVGKIQGRSYTRTLLDQLSEGQVQWHPLDVNFDTVRFASADLSLFFCSRYLIFSNSRDKPSGSMVGTLALKVVGVALPCCLLPVNVMFCNSCL